MALRKIAILGGGVAALSAAFELTEQDPQHQLFDITVYTIGWRLGGKGAVGRDKEKGYRAEEHGLHVWTGFYDNAFELVDRLYAAMNDLDLSPPFGSRENAFEGLDRSVLMEPFNSGWTSWTIDIPPHEGIPGTPRPAVSLVDFLRSLLECSVQQSQSIAGFTDQWPAGTQHSAVAAGTTDGPFRTARAKIDILPQDPRAVSPSDAAELQTILRHARTQLCDKPPSAAMSRDPREIVAEVALTIAIGMLSDGVLWQGFDCIDHQEWTDWMRSNGCSDSTLDSAIIRGCYDYVFGFFGSRHTHEYGNVIPCRNVAAGTGTRILLKLLFTYRGSFFYLLKATMGELLFAPLYQVLTKRHVKFEFFTKVEHIGLSQDKASIEFIDTTVQATTHSGNSYDPLIWIGADGTIPSWPSHPDYCQLVQGQDLRDQRIDLESAWTKWPGVAPPRKLRRGRDFDDVVLGIGIGAFCTICSDLICHTPGWREMVDAIKTTATVAFQAWTSVGMRELGCKQDRTALSGFVLPLDTWADLSLMLPLEKWPQSPPKGLAYFVGSLVDDPLHPPPPFCKHSYPARMLARQRRRMLHWVESNLHFLWPGIEGPGHAIRWERFFDYRAYSPPTRRRFFAQYPRVNINPSDRYVLSVPGSVFKRMEAGKSGVDNLFLAGDWVRTGINAGCIEASVMAGRAAAAAIAGVDIAMPNANDFNDVSLPTALLPALDLLRKLATNAVAGTGEIEAFCVVQQRPRCELEKMLPDGLTLLEPPAPHSTIKTAHHGTSSDAEGKTERTPEIIPEPPHHVVLIFARQRNVRPGPLPFGGAHYLEIAQLIPDVVHKNAPSLQNVLFSYMPHLFVSSLAATLIGQNFYGFNKQVARIQDDNDSFSMRSSSGTIRTWFERDGVPGGIDSYLAIKQLRDKLDQPLVGVQPDGNFIYSMLKYGLGGAVVQPIKGKVALSSPFAHKAEEFELAPISKPPQKDDSWGFRFIAPWTLSLPFNFPAGQPSSSARNLARATGEYSTALLGRILVRR
ncbi:NAD(P)-binding protein [Bradyrhizobium pachyrhizi]|uniref:NAD(P)-binding protein n=1 Tax=Bradyrhizobium pachyrhizi TaxID=280333 RepID=UPI000A8831C6|nr:NAD(P)-binding protein [Bradyrhizobium pachyrhizi]